MSLKNNFDIEKLKEIFLFSRQECWLCGQNHADCFHHILGRKSNSLLNSAPLGNEKCHLYNPKLSDRKVIQYLLVKTLWHLVDNKYEFTEKDKEFMQNNWIQYCG